MPAIFCTYTFDNPLLLQFLQMIFHSIFGDAAYVCGNFFAACVGMAMYVFNDCALHF